ncbi:hypothetical protein V6Z12_A07G142000 [Gossypium hirsutum]
MAVAHEICSTRSAFFSSSCQISTKLPSSSRIIFPVLLFFSFHQTFGSSLVPRFWGYKLCD